MEVLTYVSDDFQENTYFIKNNNEVIIIDPGIDINSIKSEISKNKFIIKYILLTHGHCDHIISASGLDKVIYAHEDEKMLIEDAELNLSVFAIDKKIILKDIKYYAGPKYELDNFEIFHTPGHTAGSVIIKLDNNLFTGDTLFFDTVGRTDLPTGDSIKLQESLEIFKKFDKNTICYPGHGIPFLLADAFKHNYFLKNR